MSKIKVKQLANNSFAVEGGKADGWVGAGTYMATANNNGYVVILNRDGKDSLFAAHYKDIEIYDEEGTKVTCNSVGDVVAGLNAFVGNFRRSAAETDPSSQALWYDEASKTLVQNAAIPAEHLVYNGDSLNDIVFDGELIFLLKSIDFQRITYVEDYLFQSFTSLESINLPLVEYVGNKVFDGCTSLQSINLGNPNDDLLISSNLYTTNLNKLTDINFNAKAITLGGNINLSLSPNLKKSCIMQLFEKLVDNTGGTAKTITVSDNTFTEEELAIATDKNYTVSIK